MAGLYQKTAINLLEAVGFAGNFLVDYDKTKGVLEKFKIDYLKTSEQKISDLKHNKKISAKFSRYYEQISTNKLFKDDSIELNLCRASLTENLISLIKMAIDDLNEIKISDENLDKSIITAIDVLKKQVIAEFNLKNSYKTDKTHICFDLEYVFFLLNSYYDNELMSMIISKPFIDEQELQAILELDDIRFKRLKQLVQALRVLENHYLPFSGNPQHNINNRAKKNGKKYLMPYGMQSLIRGTLFMLNKEFNLKIQSIIKKDELIKAIETDFNILHK